MEELKCTDFHREDGCLDSGSSESSKLVCVIVNNRMPLVSLTKVLHYSKTCRREYCTHRWSKCSQPWTNEAPGHYGADIVLWGRTTIWNWTNWRPYLRDFWQASFSSDKCQGVLLIPQHDSDGQRAFTLTQGVTGNSTFDGIEQPPTYVPTRH